MSELSSSSSRLNRFRWLCDVMLLGGLLLVLLVMWDDCREDLLFAIFLALAMKTKASSSLLSITCTPFGYLTGF